MPTTIFITGESANTTTGREVISIINARPDLFDLGNHSYSHPDMTKLTVAQIIDQLRRAETAILATAKQSQPPMFRAPYGALDNDVLFGAGRAGYAWTVCGRNTLDALPRIVAGLHARGYTLVTLDRLLGS